jgi:hypothetical protein
MMQLQKKRFDKKKKKKRALLKHIHNAMFLYIQGMRVPGKIHAFWLRVNKKNKQLIKPRK